MQPTPSAPHANVLPDAQQPGKSPLHLTLQAPQ
jgi:hypothetical protein